jgi:mannose/fructose/N-acetylgalactosamine-specific phosphotransferase system component IID/mannose/fructose/N-acetylgalactosamine-specific phosphotransferase system component IIC
MKATRKQISLAMGISLLLVLASVVAVQAAPADQAAQPAPVNILIAIIVGVLYYCANSPFFANIGFTVLYRPLVAGTLVGILMGRPGEGIAIGANINVLYLGWISAGGSLPGDPALAGYLGTALALGSGLGVQGALAVAAPLGLLGSLTWSLRMSLCSIIPHWADALAEKADIKGVARANYIYSQPFLFVLYAVPVMLAAYLGTAAVKAGLDWIGQYAGWVMGGLFVASGMLAALGIGLNLKFLLRGNVWPYFFIGFVVATLQGSSVNLLMLAIVGAGVAILHVAFTTKEEAAPTAQAAAAPRAVPGLLTRNDVFSAWLRWLFFSHSAYNWERMQGMGFAHSMTPIIAKLYKNKEDITAALKRHLVFFNTQPDIGGVIHGVVIAMEEERATGADISDDAINGVKTGLMGPMAGIGDTIQQGIVIPICLAIGMSVATGGAVGSATSGNFVGVILFVVLVAAFTWGVGWWLWWQGYLQGRTFVTSILQSGALNKVIEGAGVLGNFIMGALAVSFVHLSTPVVGFIGGTKFEVQKIIDSFMPNLLPLLLVLLVWWLVTKKKVNPTWIMVAMIIIGILGAAPIFPGLDAKGGPIWVGLFG